MALCLRVIAQTSLVTWIRRIDYNTFLDKYLNAKHMVLQHLLVLVVAARTRIDVAKIPCYKTLIFLAELARKLYYGVRTGFLSLPPFQLS